MAGIPTRSQNLLLRGLSRDDYRSLAPHLEQVPLLLDDVLAERNKPNTYVYFPLAGLISVHTIFADHASWDLIGKEGMVGVLIAAGIGTPKARIAVQLSGAAMRVAAREFQILANRSGLLQKHMHRYTCLLLQRCRQTSRCNGLHQVEARLARCLLELSDRGESLELRATHELLGIAIGAQRAAVRIAASVLRDRNLIKYTRARLKIVDRNGLIKAACRCYRPIL